MAMTWTTLTASKSTNGSIASWVNYSKLDVETILDEAQALLYGVLRTREMRTRYTFYMDVGYADADLPSNFLDAIGRMYAPAINMQFRHKDESFVNEARIYQTSTGSMGTDPFTTALNSSEVNVTLTGHGFNAGSIITFVDVAGNVGGLDFNGSFDIIGLVDDDTFTIDATPAGTATSTGTGGGSGATYVCNSLVQGSPIYWAVWDEKIHFDCAFVQAMTCTLQYYKSPPLLSADNETNFLTNRYPQLLRTACVAAAADFMKDDSEYNKGMARLTSLVQTVNAENDMGWRSMELDTEIP